jgi:predicted RNA polymerase sigma factor
LGNATRTDVTHYVTCCRERAYLLRRLGRPAEARDAFRRAAGLTEDPALRAYLLEHAIR